MVRRIVFVHVLDIKIIHFGDREFLVWLVFIFVRNTDKFGLFSIKRHINVDRFTGRWIRTHIFCWRVWTMDTSGCSFLLATTVCRMLVWRIRLWGSVIQIAHTLYDTRSLHDHNDPVMNGE